MRIKNIPVCGIFLILCSCSSNNDEEASNVSLEFDILCDKYTSLVNLGEYATLDNEERALRLEGLLSKGLSRSSNAYIAWTAIRNGPASERHFLFKEAADSVGYKQWECPAIKEHGHEIGS